VTRAAESEVLIESLIERLEAAYVAPEGAAAAASLVRAELARGRYESVFGVELCERISADLLTATGDRHLRLLWHDGVGAASGEEQLVGDLIEQFRLENQGVRRVEQLERNIGLIELTVIPPAALAGEAITAAIQLVQHTEALILDLRGARGGSPDGVAFFVSYLMPDGDVHLNDIVEGANGPTRQYWTSAYVPGPRYLDRPVYVLTSATTFSGGEELAYDLQALGRALVVGEVTRGGAHPSTVVSLGDNIELRLPIARTVNAVTGRNWEGVGVRPDLPGSAGDALELALGKIAQPARVGSSG